MPSRNVPEKIHLHPVTGQMCSFAEFAAAGGAADNSPEIMAANARFEAREAAIPETVGVQIIRDIEPYRAVASDIATGKPPVITGRRQHREFLNRNGYREIGNEQIKPQREELSRSERVQDIKRAMGE